MWEVVGFRQRVKQDKVYYDIYLQRECKNGQGFEVKAGNYASSQVDYVPRIGDRVAIETGSFNGREYVRDIVIL